MGQYYYPIYLSADGKILGWMHAHAYNNGLKLTEHSYMNNSFVNTFERGLVPGARFYRARVVWAGDYADPEASGENLNSMCDEYSRLCPEPKNPGPRYILNHSKRVFVDKEKVPSNNGMTYHPLPILTAEGGGGDCDDSPLVGSWARDEISVEDTHLDFQEIVFDLVVE